MILVSLILTLPPLLEATDKTHEPFTNWAAWHAYVDNITLPAGCFKATYPNAVWQRTQCTAAPLVPLTVGKGNDWVVNAPSGKLMGRSIGSFTTVESTSVFGETDSLAGANAFSLQVNSQTFTTSTIYTGSVFAATGWEQFVFLSSGAIYIQYWLIGYHSTYGGCPGLGPPGGSSWAQSGTNCWANSPSNGAPSESPNGLVQLSLGGYANQNGSGNDKVNFCVYETSCYVEVLTDHVLDLYKHWSQSEFNVFGWGNSSQANFNSGTTIGVKNTSEDPNGKAIVPHA